VVTRLPRGRGGAVPADGAVARTAVVGAIVHVVAFLARIEHAVAAVEREGRGGGRRRRRGRRGRARGTRDRAARRGRNRSSRRRDGLAATRPAVLARVAAAALAGLSETRVDQAVTAAGRDLCRDARLGRLLRLEVAGEPPAVGAEPADQLHLLEVLTLRPDDVHDRAPLGAPHLLLRRAAGTNR